MTTFTRRLRREPRAWPRAALPVTAGAGLFVTAVGVSAALTGRLTWPGVVLGLATGVVTLNCLRLQRDGALNARRDELTGVLNRAGLLAVAGGHPPGAGAGGLLLMDVDDFEDVNNRHGHAFGDELLRAVVARTCDAVGEDGTVGRLGGDEFGVVVAPGVDPSSLAERIRAAVSDPFDVGEVTAEVTVSIGVAPPGAADPVTAADVALHEAKRAGKRVVRVHTADMTEAARRRAALRADLRHALERDEIWVAYQPIVDVRYGGVVWLEALARWEHPVHGNVPPTVFIPEAESIGVIAGIDAFVMRRATADAAAVGLAVSVNVSLRRPATAELSAMVQDALLDSGLAADRLLVEVTETALSEDRDAVVRQVESVRALGALVAVDDFGTGHSALGRLAELPVDVLKVDRSFLAGSPRGRDVLTVVADLGARLGLRTIVEGVERQDQIDMVAEMGFDCVQGYALSKPRALPLLRTEHLRAPLRGRGVLPVSPRVPHPSEKVGSLPRQEPLERR